MANNNNNNNNGDKSLMQMFKEKVGDPKTVGIAAGVGLVVGAVLPFVPAIPLALLFGAAATDKGQKFCALVYDQITNDNKRLPGPDDKKGPKGPRR